MFDRGNPSTPRSKRAFPTTLQVSKPTPEGLRYLLAQPPSIGGFARLPNWLMRVKAKKLPTAAKIIYAKLLNHAGKQTGEKFKAWPFQETLGNETGLSKDVCRKMVKELVAFGLLTSKRGLRAPLEYRFLYHPIMGDLNQAETPEDSVFDEVSHSTAVKLPEKLIPAPVIKETVASVEAEEEEPCEYEDKYGNDD